MDASQRTVYHISPLRLWLAPAIFVIVAVFMPVLAVFDASGPKALNAGILMGIVFLVLGAGMYLLLRYTRLVLAADGVKLYQIGYVLETNWDNVAYLDDFPDSEGLVLHQPMNCAGAYKLAAKRDVRVGGAALFTEEQIQLIAEHRLIPLNTFSYRLKQGGLREDFIRRAPHLNRHQK